MGGQLGALDVNERVIKKVPVEAETGNKLCCCLRLFGGSTSEDGRSKRKTKSKKRNGYFTVDTTKDESTRLHDNLLSQSYANDPDGLLIRDNRKNSQDDVPPIH